MFVFIHSLLRVKQAGNRKAVGPGSPLLTRVLAAELNFYCYASSIFSSIKTVQNTKLSLAVKCKKLSWEHVLNLMQILCHLPSQGCKICAEQMQSPWAAARRPGWRKFVGRTAICTNWNLNLLPSLYFLTNLVSNCCSNMFPHMLLLQEWIAHVSQNRSLVHE